MLLFTERLANHLQRLEFAFSKVEPIAGNRVVVQASDGQSMIVLAQSDCIAIAKAAGWPTPRQDKRR